MGPTYLNILNDILLKNRLFPPPPKKKYITSDCEFFSHLTSKVLVPPKKDLATTNQNYNNNLNSLNTKSNCEVYSPFTFWAGNQAK